MKFLRILFSKWSISALLLLAQVAAIALLIIYLNEYYYVFQIAAWVIGILVVLVLVNRKENPEYKIPWLFLVLALPIFGTLFYLLFSHTRIRKRDRKLYAKAYEELKPYIEDVTQEEEALLPWR